jgi:hypothetical protein
VTNAADLTLGSAAAKILNQSKVNALLGFTTNTAAAEFTVSGGARLTTDGGDFTNSGLFTVAKQSAFTVGGASFNFTQTAGTTTVDGTLAGAGAGSLDLDGGSLFGAGRLDYNVLDGATITPGDSATKTGKLAVAGTYTQNASGALDVTIAGTKAGTKYDQLDVAGAASLNGTLNITLAGGYTPKVGSTFDILNASSISGSFTTISGLAINGSESFQITTVNGDEIVLTVVAGAAQAAGASLTQLHQAGAVRGRYGREVLTGQHQLAAVEGQAATQGTAPYVPGIPAGLNALRPRDVFGSPVAGPALDGAGDAIASGSLGISPVSAAAYNSMGAMNHMRFECGLDLKTMLKISRKQLLKGLWAAPDSPDALSIGYMTYTGNR